MNKRIHIGWVVALIVVVIAGQGFAQFAKKPKPVGTYNIAANSGFLYAIDSSNGDVWKLKLSFPLINNFWEPMHLKGLP